MISLYKPFVPDLPELENIVYSGSLSQGSYSRKFEARLTYYLNGEHALIVNSFNNALFIVLSCIGIKSGDYVIVSPMCCLASTQPLSMFGVRILWADVDPKTGTLCPDSVRKLFKYNVKAILHNHFAGFVGHISQINQIARENDVPVIEDCIEAFGSQYLDRYINQQESDYTVYSFNPVRFMNTVDGGAIFFKDKKKYKLATLFRDAGIDRTKFRDEIGEINPECDISLPSFSATPNEISAYIGLRQLDEIDYLLNTHKENTSLYDDFSCNSNVSKIKQDDSCPNYWVFGCLVEDNRALIKILRDKGINSSAIHLRNDNYSIFKNDVNQMLSLPGVTEFSRQFIALPCGWWLSEEEKKYIKSVLSELNKY
jgi:perosamine synthetase